MGEWSDYFEDFPEENPANYVGGVFNPQGAQRLREEKARIEKECSEFRGKIYDLIEKHSSKKSIEKLKRRV